MKKLLYAFTWAALGVTAAQASVMITFDAPNQFGSPGDTLRYFGRITNLDTGNSVYLNSASINLTATPGDFIVADLFFDNVPLSLGAEATSELIEFFSVVITTPFPDAFVTYTGSYQLLGGADGDAMEILGGADFSATPTENAPEPLTAGLLGAGLAALAFSHRRR